MLSFNPGDVKTFYVLFQMGYCTFGAFILLMLWRRFDKLELAKIDNTVRRHNGLFWMMVATGVWIVAGFWVWIEDYIIEAFGVYIFALGTMFWSGINNVSILLALPYFEKRLPFFDNSDFWFLNWRLFCFSLFFIPLTFGMGLMYFVDMGDIDSAFIPDMIVSVGTMILLLLALRRSFNFRNPYLRGIAYASLFSVSLVIFSQVFYTFLPWLISHGSAEEKYYTSLLKLILLFSKVTLVTIFILLVIDWMTNMWMHSQNRLMQIIVIKNNDKTYIKLNIPERIRYNEEELLIKGAQLVLLNLFIEDKITNGENSWINADKIKYTPSNYSTIMKRILIELKVTKNRHLFIREKQGKKVYHQLRIPVENIIFEQII